MRIGIVNDSPLAVQVLRRVLTERTSHRVAWVAENGIQAITYCRQDPPDLVLMDLIMPQMNGVEATRRIMEEKPVPILIVTASVDGNSPMIFEAMGFGARDVVHTPVLSVSDGDGGVDGLLRKIAVFERLADTRNRPKPDEPCPFVTQNVPLVLIGASTGGPKALREILWRLPSDFPAGIVIAQHVDAGFAANMAQWLSEQTRLRVRIVKQDDCIEPGVVQMAATQDHLVIGHRQRLRYVNEPAEKLYRPSVDVLFQSAAKHWKTPGVAVVLTGMGTDGAQGLLTLRRAGWTTLVQDAESCAVYGMPKACMELGAAMAQIPIDRMAVEIERLVRNLLPCC